MSALSRLRTRLRRLLQLADATENPVVFTKYLRGRPPGTDLALHYMPAPGVERLPLPPPALWLGYGESEADYLDSGAKDVRVMTELLAGAGLDLMAPPAPVLELGCGGGRMLRHLLPATGSTEVWGLDISAPHIHWLRMHLSPPFHFAVNTTLPHLPFAEGYFSCVYCGSVFTHIDDFAEAWWLEIRRVLRPGGVLFCTLHDDDTRRLLQQQPHYPLARNLRSHPSYLTAGALLPDVLAIGEGNDSNVYYSNRWLHATLSRLFEIVRVVPGAYGYQSAWILRKRPA